ncbi:MAG: FadR family transcriptional regulator [Candidatus Fermentithermobacillus carboniphilus]|uniref:FadR family transcriptional regulator n=1 Tax=Candidatus Fermentithermobacillus carboniphilus TaxID=3085328 RepID=A0AAT9LD95_9FIRM|nr:MAG: FadR family transcriptional regulator [Candidatus Fermentithermobacillus carboniphilus]
MEFKKLTTQKLPDKVKEQFVELIKNGVLKPGDRLPPERDLAGHLGVSRGVLREALQVLEAHGYITRKPGGGTYVRELGDQLVGIDGLCDKLKQATFMDLLEAREAIEEKAVQLAIQRASDEDLAQMESILAQAKQGAGTPELDRAFHLCIASATKNVVITNFMSANLELIKDITSQTHRLPGRSDEMIKEHEKILNAIRHRDPLAARAAVLEHLTNVRNAVLKVFSGEGERNVKKA